MLWNIVIHALIGMLGTQFFTLTASGVGFCLAIVSLTQVSEMLRYYLEEKKKIMEGPPSDQAARLETFRRELPQKLPSLFLQNLLLYSAIVLLAAEMGRSSGTGL